MSSALSLLFLGNSYVQNQQLDQTVAAMLQEGTGQATLGARLTGGGLTFADHVANAQGADEHWVSALASDASAWSWVVLQEQSQIPGFPEDHKVLQESLAAAGTLDGYAQDRGAQTVLMMTWGRREGDPTNPSLYPDFTTMQDLLTEGYLRYVSTHSSEERQLWVAPCGLAWQSIHDDLLAEGSDPLAEGSLFWRLYSSDGSHPSPVGNHLNAAVIYATLTGVSPVGLSDPSGLVDDETAAALQAVAAAVVLSDTPEIDYPWRTDEDTLPAESDDTDTEEAEPDHGEPEGTGCRDRRALAVPVLLLPLLGMRRR